MSIQIGVDYYPEQWPEQMWEQDADRMKECGVKVVRMAEFAWSRMEPEEGIYDFEWLVLLDEAFSKMDQERSAVCLKYARKMDLQLIVCVPDERLQSLIRNVDCVYGFRRHNNQISMMHIDKGDYLKLMEG